MKNKKFLWTIVLVNIITGVFCACNVSALTLDSNSEIYKKAVRQGIRECYTSQPLESKVFPADWKSNDDLKGLFDNSVKVGMPTGYTDLKKENTVGCKNFFFGDPLGSGASGTYDGIMKIYKKSISSSANLEAKKNLAAGLGYEPAKEPAVTNTSDSFYYTLSYTYYYHYSNYYFGCNWFGNSCESDSDTYDAAALLTNAKVKNDGTIDGGLTITESGNGQTIDDFGVDYKDGKLTISCSTFWNSWGNLLTAFIGVYNGKPQGDCSDGSLAITSGSTKWNDGDKKNGKSASGGTVVGFLNTHLPMSFSVTDTYTSAGDPTNGTGGSTTTYTYYYTANGTISNDPDYVEQKTNQTLPGQYNIIGSIDDRAAKVMKYFTGGTTRKFTDAETYVLYAGYLVDYYAADFQCGSDKAEHYNGRDGYVKASNILYEGKIESECYVKATKNTSDKVNAVGNYNGGGDRGGQNVFHGQKTWKELLTQIASLKVTAEDIAAADLANASESEQPENTGTETTCVSSGGAQSLGWIVCPILDWMGNASAGLYNNYVEPALQVKPKLFTGGNSATKDGWETFRNIANVLLIILFLVVIFSQLTGYGIDNYGIKKILPKIIVAGILMNLSYWICVALVDVSNILGNSLQSMFDGLASGLTVPADVQNKMGGGALVSVGVLGALVVAGAAVWANPAILLTLLISALGVIVSVFFLFILLAAREAAIVVLTVLSSLAIACFMLPNTKKFFDKWWKFFYSLLLVYPICGLLIGGGNYVSKLLLSGGIDESGNFFKTFTAMIVGIIPVFFIPTVLKGSLNMLGSLGTKISGFGDRMSGSLKSGAKNSERYKNAQQMGAERRTRIKAGVDRNGNETRRGARKRAFATTSFGRAVGADRRLNRQVQAANKIRNEGVEAGAALINQAARTEIAQEYDGNAARFYTEQFERAAVAGDGNAMDAALAAAKSSGYVKNKDIAKMVRDRINTPNGMNFANSALQSTWLRDAAVKHSDVFGTDFELNDYMRKGGLDKSGNQMALGGYGDYARSGNVGVDDIKPGDFGNLSGDSIAGLATSGFLTAPLAQSALAENPNLSADKKIMLGSIASEVASVVGKNMDDFKAEAKMLMGNAAAATSIIKPVDESQVKAWMSAKPQDVNVVQNFQGGGQQFNPVEIRIEHKPTPPTPPSA